MGKPVRPSPSDGTTVTALSAILGGEQKAGEVIAAARERARDRVAAAQEQVPAILARGEERALEVAQQETNTIKEDTDRRVLDIASARELELAELRSRLSSHLPHAVKLAVARAADPSLDACGILPTETALS